MKKKMPVLASRLLVFFATYPISSVILDFETSEVILFIGAFSKEADYCNDFFFRRMTTYIELIYFQELVKMVKFTVSTIKIALLLMN